MATKPRQIITTVSFRSKAEMKACQRKARVRHSGLSACIRDLFRNYKP